MGNQLYDENKRLKAEIEELQDSLRHREEREAMPKLIEACATAFLQGRAEFHVSIYGQPTYGIRFLVDQPPRPAKSPTDAS